MINREQTYAYAEVERAIAAVMGVGAEQMGALRGRIKYLKSLRWPDVDAPGTGQRVRYTRHHAFRLLLALTLEWMGCAPRYAWMTANPPFESPLPEKDIGIEFLVVTPDKVDGLTAVTCSETDLLLHLRRGGASFVIPIAALLVALDEALGGQLSEEFGSQRQNARRSA